MSNETSKKVWLAIGNTDCTEGRGRPLIKYVCETKATAIRLGRNGSVQGSDCYIKESVAIFAHNQWLVPGYIEKATDTDITNQSKIDAREATLKKLKDLGMTDDEMRSLGVIIK